MQVWGTQPNRSPNGLHLGGGANGHSRGTALSEPISCFQETLSHRRSKSSRPLSVTSCQEACEGGAKGRGLRRPGFRSTAGKMGWLCREEVLQSAGRGEPPKVKIQKGCAQWDTGELNASLWVQGTPTEPARRDGTIQSRVLTIKGPQGLGTGQRRSFKCQHAIPV